MRSWATTNASLTFQAIKQPFVHLSKLGSGLSFRHACCGKVHDALYHFLLELDGIGCIIVISWHNCALSGSLQIYFRFYDVVMYFYPGLVHVQNFSLYFSFILKYAYFEDQIVRYIQDFLGRKWTFTSIGKVHIFLYLFVQDFNKLVYVI